MSRSRDLANLGGDATGLETLTVSDITDLTATATELNYTDGVGSALQTQINAKSPIASPTFTGTTNVSSGVTLPSNPTIVLGSNATFPAGYIIQTVFNDTYGQIAIDSASWDVAHTAVTTTITPKYANSKIFLMADINIYWNVASVHLHYDFYKNASDFTETANLSGKTNGCGLIGAGSHETPGYIQQSYTFLDSAGSVTEKTYKVSARQQTASGTAYIGYGNSDNQRTMHLNIFEIAQ